MGIQPKDEGGIIVPTPTVKESPRPYDTGQALLSLHRSCPDVAYTLPLGLYPMAWPYTSSSACIISSRFLCTTFWSLHRDGVQLRGRASPFNSRSARNIPLGVRFACHLEGSRPHAHAMSYRPHRSRHLVPPRTPHPRPITPIQ